MSDHKIPKIPVQDPIGAAMNGVDAKEEAAKLAQVEADRAEFIRTRRLLFPDHFFADYRLPDGRPFQVIVPNDFDADQFETVVGVLMQIRVAADQKREAEKNSGLVVPDHGLVAPNGRRLT